MDCANFIPSTHLKDNVHTRTRRVRENMEQRRLRARKTRVLG